MKVSPVVRCQRCYNYIITDPRKTSLCSFCIILAISVQKVIRSPVRPKFLRKMRASFLDINHLNDQMHEMTYIWQSQAPVSINMSLTIKCLLKECKAEEVPYSLFFRTVNRGNSCELKPKKKRSCLASMSRFIPVFKSFLSVQI